MNQRLHLGACVGACVAMLMACAAASLAQQQDAKPAPPAPEPAQPPSAQPTLDELLGLPTNAPKPDAPPAPDATKPAPPAGTTPDTTQRELDRQLQARPVSDEFVKAVSMMQETTQRLRDAQDTGPQTQRLQQEIIKALDKLIEDAKQNQSKSSSSSSSSSSSQSSSQSQSQKQSSQQQQSSSTKAGDAKGGNVSQSQAQAKPPPPGAGAAWGNLPAHVREALQQGFSDEFSSTYQRLTEEYYKRLADSPADRRRGP